MHTHTHTHMHMHMQHDMHMHMCMCMCMWRWDRPRLREAADQERSGRAAERSEAAQEPLLPEALRHRALCIEHRVDALWRALCCPPKVAIYTYTDSTAQVQRVRGAQLAQHQLPRLRQGHGAPWLE